MRRHRWQIESRSQNKMATERISLVLILALLVPMKCVGQTTDPTTLVPGTTTEPTSLVPSTVISTATATTTPPVTLSCPDNILTNTTEVDYTVPTASDGTSPVQCTPAPGTFDEGETTVVCVALNSQNVTVASCSFNVTVDTTPPNAIFASCPEDILSNETIIYYDIPEARDDQENLAVTCRPYPPGVAFPEGDTTVVCIAADEVGNVATANCTFIVTIDTTRPVAEFTNCSEDILTNEATVYYPEPTASEGNVQLSVSCDPPSGSPFQENQDTTVVCTASDAAGNVANETCTFNVTVDTTPPVAEFTNCSGDILTNEATVYYPEPTASDEVDVPLNVTCTPPSGSPFQENQETTVVCTASDAAGNVAEKNCTFVVTVHTTRPVAEFTNCSEDILTNEATVYYPEPTASEGNVQLSVSCDPPSGSPFQENQDTTVVCTASDAAGNVANETCTFNVTVDTTPPVAEFTNCSGDILTNEATVYYPEPTASDEVDVPLNVTCTPPSGSPFQENQETTVVCTASDAAGNVAEKNCTFVVTVDTTRPVAEFTNCSEDILTNEATVYYPEPTASEGNVQLSVSCDPPSGSPFQENQDTTVVCTASDAAGNVANETCTFNVTVDTTPPVAEFTNCPKDILTNEETVYYPEPTASEGSVPLNVTCDPPSGTPFLENQETTVVCTASDAAGNVANKTCTFNVTVDTTPPVAEFTNCCGDILTNEATVYYPEPTASDEVDVPLNVTCTPPSGSPFQENQETTVVCTASDAAGNVAEKNCTFVVTVDTTRPVAEFTNCSEDILTNEATVYYPEPTASEGSVPLNVTCNPPSGSAFPQNQETTVVCTASDAAGNVANETCTFNVTVDTSPPELDPDTCPSDSSYYADYATNSTTVMWDDPEASDNLDPAPVVTCLPRSDTKFEIGEWTVTCSAMDAAGNEATLPCTFQVNVTELRAPTIDDISNVSNETMLVTWSSPDAVENFTVEYTGSFDDTVTKTTTLPGTENSYELTGLVPGETYTIKVISESEHALAESEERTRTTELNKPTITDVTSSSMREMTVTWTAPANSVVERYKVEYTGLKQDIETKNVMLNGTDLSTELVELLPGETYRVKVEASSGTAESKQVFAESLEAQETTVPMNVTLRESDSTVSSITADWSAPTDPQTSLASVIEYYIIRCSEGNPEPGRLNYSTTTLQASCANLTPAGKEYIITVESHSGDKSSPASLQIIALPNGVNLTEGDSTTSSVSASWVFPGGEVDRFDISCSAGTATPAEILIGSSTPPPFYEASCTSLPTPGRTYIMTVFVESEGKTSNSSHIQLIALPEAVESLSVDSVTTTQATISWDIPSNGIVTSFSAFYPGLVPQTIEYKDGKTSYETSFPGLEPGREYSFSVVALSSDKQSAEETATKRTTPAAIDGFVSNITDKTSITVSWNEPDGVKDRYTVSIDPNEGTLEPRKPLDPTAIFSGLTPGKPYYISVVTSSGNLNSSRTRADFVTKPDLSGPVGKLVIDEIQLNSVRVRFEEPEVPNGAITSYDITYSGEWKGKVDPEKVISVTLDQIPYVITDLLPGYTYNIRVQAINGAGVGVPESKVVKTLTKAPPSDNPAKPEPFDDQNESTKPTTTSITARFLDTYFSHSNGELVNYTVIVAEEGAVTSDITDSPPDWSEAKDKNPIPPYQAFMPREYPFPPVSTDSSGQRKRRATPREEIVILGNGNCQSSTASYCNGPLRDDTSYVYLFRVWNDGGYADTAFSQPVKTANDNSLELGLGLGVSFGILFVVLITLVLLVVRRRTQTKRPRTNSNYQNEGFEHDVIPVRRKGNTRPVRVEDFPDHYRTMKADSDYLFSEEYEELRPIGKDQAALCSVLEVNRSKNRFVNILPYDHTRVKLKQVDDEDGSDYINANFMPGYNSPREFIACQGPLPGTEDDMWRLVWEQRVTNIVMVTQLIEKGRVKCHKYWPSEDKPVYFGDIFVTLLSETKLSLWTIREFQLEKGERKRRVCHYNFTAWPDHGVPDNTEGILRFVRNVRNQIPQNGRPTLVHCSAGVGRTGTFICLDRLMQHLKEYDYIDVFGIVHEMRMHRNFMVQTEDQYVFIHECIMDMLQSQQSNGSNQIYENMAV